MNKILSKLRSFGNLPIVRFIAGFLSLFASLFLIELLVFVLLRPDDICGLSFGALWSLALSAFILFLPRKAGRIVYGILYFAVLLWGLAQAGYHRVFDKMMWLSTIAYAGEGAVFLGDVLASFGLLWWLSLLVMVALGVLLIKWFPHSPAKLLQRAPYLGICAVSLVVLFFLPEIVFQRDNWVWGAKDEYKQSSSYRATYNTMYDAKKVYDITGLYQLIVRDIWVNELYPLTPGYRATLSSQTKTVDAYFAKRGDVQRNEMTGAFAGKNVVLVLMESMDDWMITPKDTPTLVKLMSEGVNFTNFYTPGYGSARTLNSEFCMNTGIYLPTTGTYVFDYVTNSFNQSFASQLTNRGYNAKVFHYNDPDFYSRGVFEPAMGYTEYVSYEDYIDDKSQLLNEEFLFDSPAVSEIFFRRGLTLNTIITRSAHLGYTYNEMIGYLALQKYPEYWYLYGSEEEICARVKAKVVDDMFARLLEELEKRGQLHNTVIIGMTDHYTYGYNNLDELYTHSSVNDPLLLEKTPCFIWSADGPAKQVSKVLSTADFLPTMLNMLGIRSPYRYLGQDAFDPRYPGYVLFPDGSWIYDGVAVNEEGTVVMNESGRTVSQLELDGMALVSQEFRTVSNLLLTCDYYKKTHK